MGNKILEGTSVANCLTQVNNRFEKVAEKEGVKHRNRKKVHDNHSQTFLPIPGKKISPDVTYYAKKEKIYKSRNRIAFTSHSALTKTEIIAEKEKNSCKGTNTRDKKNVFPKARHHANLILS